MADAQVPSDLQTLHTSTDKVREGKVPIVGQRLRSLIERTGNAEADNKQLRQDLADAQKIIVLADEIINRELRPTVRDERQIGDAATTAKSALAAT